VKTIDKTGSVNQNGFTLLELLVVFLILIVLLSILYSSFTGTFRTIEETEAQTNVYSMARIALDRISEDLESAYIYNDSDTEEDNLHTDGFLGEDIKTNGRSSDSLRFNSRAHINFAEDLETAGRARIAYYVKESDKKESFLLYRSDTAEFEQGPEERKGGLLLCKGLHSVDFTYQDDNGEILDNWNSTSTEYKDRLPVMVSIRLEFTNQSALESPLKFSTAVIIPLARNGHEKKP